MWYQEVTQKNYLGFPFTKSEEFFYADLTLGVQRIFGHWIYLVE